LSKLRQIFINFDTVDIGLGCPDRADGACAEGKLFKFGIEVFKISQFCNK